MGVSDFETYLAVTAVVLALAVLIVLGGRLWLQLRDYWKWLS